MIKLKHIAIFLLLLLAVINVSAQRKGKKSMPLMISYGGGIAGGDFGGLSAYGPNLMIDFRKPFSRIGNSMSLTFDNHLSLFPGFFEFRAGTKFAALPSIASAIDFNAFTGAGRKSRSPVGGFLGLGIYGIASPSLVLPEYNSDSKASFDVGPYINAGARIKMNKKHYMTVKLFGGFTVSQEFAYGGLNILWSMGSGKKKFARKDDCGC